MSNLRVAKTEEFDKIFSILENSFPSDEYRTYEGQQALWNHPRYTVYVIPDDESDCIKAFITVWKFEDFAEWYLPIRHSTAHRCQGRT